MMHRRAALMWLALLVSALATGAQSLGTTGTPIGNWRDVRGTNYVVATATARNNVQMWLDPGPNHGTFDAAVVDQELGLLAAHGLNSVRVFGSFFAHVVDPAQYLANLRTVLAACRTHGLRVTFVLWDVFGLDGLDVPVLTSNLHGAPLRARILRIVNDEMTRLCQNHPDLPAGWGGTWFASPGNRFLVSGEDPQTWPPVFRELADAYLESVARLFAGDFSDTFLSYDFVNEPDNLLYLRWVNPATMAHISALLSAYSLDRITPMQPEARFTIGTGNAFLGIVIHRRLRGLAHRGLDYLSYHDYLSGGGFLERALHAATLGTLEQREMVCSEFFMAARQGHLPILLASLDRVGVGGQLWSAIEDRIFVVRYDQALGRRFLGNPTCWWVRDTGVFRPVTDPNSPTGWRYDVKNAVFARALRIWAVQETPLATSWPRLAATCPLPNVDPRLVKLTVEGPVGLPVTLLVGNASTHLTYFPGFPVPLLDGTTLGRIPIGRTEPTSTPHVGRISLTTRLPATVLAGTLPVQAILGSDYDLLRWETASQTVVTDVLRLP
ncbi:MAG: hypothetical protein JXQ29_04980 [Planctomycetes bacterium]|nr:hypothetical protein [Planctomycetota bacterium]